MEQRPAIEEDTVRPVLWEPRCPERANALPDENNKLLGGERRRTMEQKVLSTGRCEAKDLAFLDVLVLLALEPA
eukprot:4165939-Lingulodinium_polyedra.AAC.1